MSNTQQNNNGLGLGGVLFVVFLVLKLTSVIDWSWWWVTAPLWGPIAFVLVIAVLVGIFVKPDPAQKFSGRLRAV